MKKNSESRVGRVFRRIIDVRTWLDWDRLKSLSLALFTGLKRMFVPQRETTGESFEAALTKFDITEADLEKKKTALWRLSILMVSAGLLIGGYAIFQLIYGTYRASIVSLVVMMIAFVLAFRYHFWYFQIKERKLGCSLQEWYKQGLRGEKE